MSLENAALENLRATYDIQDEWGAEDIEDLMVCLQSSANTLDSSIEHGYDRDTIVADLGRCLRYLQGLAICHKSHFAEAVMLDRELNC